MPSKTEKRVVAGAKTQRTSERKTSAQPPIWPLIQPTLPATDLTFQVLLENQILTIPNFWTSTLCKTYTNFLATLPLSTTPGVPRRGDAVRVNDRFQVDDAEFAHRLWADTALKELILHPSIAGETLSEGEKCALWGGEILGLNSNIRIYRYKTGQFFDRHFDDSNNVSFPSASTSNALSAKTTWTLLIYLSSPATGCIGGETVFYPEASHKRAAAPPPVIADLAVGTALLHRHGKDCLLHEGREVKGGEKWVIRSDLCVKR